MSDAIGIVTTLTDWGAVTTRADLQALLDLVECRCTPSRLRCRRCCPAGRRGRAAAPRPCAAGRCAAALRHRPRTPGRAGRPATRLTLSPLPAPATALIGRERERTEVVAAVAASRLVTLTGPGGTGKTRLALQAARDLAGNFADGVAFIDLAPVRDAA